MGLGVSPGNGLWIDGVYVLETGEKTRKTTFSVVSGRLYFSKMVTSFPVIHTLLQCALATTPSRTGVCSVLLCIWVFTVTASV